MNAGYGAQRQGYGNGNEHAQHRNLQCDREPQRDFFHHRLAGPIRGSEIAHRHAAKEPDILLQHRTVEAQPCTLGSNNLHRGVAALGPQHGLDRVAGKDMQHEESHSGHPQQSGNGKQQAIGDISQHIVLLDLDACDAMSVRELRAFGHHASTFFAGKRAAGMKHAAGWGIER